jgi:hypothetical protein
MQEMDFLKIDSILTRFFATRPLHFYGVGLTELETLLSELLMSSYFEWMLLGCTLVPFYTQ